MNAIAQDELRVFLSSTRNDLNSFRDTVMRAIEHGGCVPVDAHHKFHPNIAIWEFIVDQLAVANYYFCLLGFRYGTRIANADGEMVSYTELEFRIAESHMTRARMAVFMPEDGSEFARVVEALAKVFDSDEYGCDAARRAADIESLERFKQDVQFKISANSPPTVDVSPRDAAARAYHRLCYKVINVDDLRKKVENVLEHISPGYFRPLASADTVSGRTEAAARPPRSPEWDAIHDTAVAAIKTWKAPAKGKTPASGMCLVISGSDPDAISLLAKDLLCGDALPTEKPCRIRLEKDQELSKPGYARLRTNTALSLIQQLHAHLEEDSGPEAETPDGLAESIYRGDEPVTCVIENVNLFAGSLEAFVEEFWHPLFDALERRRKESPWFADRPAVLLIATYGRVRLRPGAPVQVATARPPASYRNPVHVAGPAGKPRAQTEHASPRSHDPNLSAE